MLSLIWCVLLWLVGVTGLERMPVEIMCPVHSTTQSVSRICDPGRWTCSPGCRDAVSRGCFPKIISPSFHLHWLGISHYVQPPRGSGEYTPPGVNTLKEIAVACDLTFQKDDTSLESWHQCENIRISASYSSSYKVSADSREELHLVLVYM